MDSDRHFIKVTADGSFTIYDNVIGATFHSIHGALNESLLIYIKYGLEYYLQNKKASTVNVLELGFGSGLNAALAFKCIQSFHSFQINYLSFDAYPMDKQYLQAFNLNMDKEQPGLAAFLQLVQQAPWNQLKLLDGGFEIFKKDGFWNDHTDFKADVIFYDAFAPSVQPELWNESSVKLISERLRKNGVLVTYCVQGKFRRLLEFYGFKTEKLNGPLGKRVVLRANK